MAAANHQGSAPAQVHFPGTPDEYLAVAEALDAEDPGASVVLATFPVSVLVNQLTLPESIEAIRLVQALDGTESTLEQLGRSFASPNAQLPIEGSAFQLGWFRSSVIGPMSILQLSGVTGIGILLAVLGVLIARRAQQGAIGQPATVEMQTPTQTEEAVEPEAPRAGETVPSAETVSDEKTRRTEVLDPDTLEPADAGKRGRGGDDVDADEDRPASKPTAVADDRGDTVDGETRREVAEQRNLDAPELVGQAPPDDAPDGPTDDREPVSDKHPDVERPESNADDDLAFDPDAQPEDPEEISNMLRALVKEGEGTEDGAAAPVEPGQTRTLEAGKGDPGSVPQITVPPASIFRAYDIRGVVGDTLSPEIATAIGRAIGSEARGRGLSRIAVARDGRLSGAELLAAVSEGIISTGLDVIDVGAVPTPVLYYAAQELGGGSGVMVTGSHNPPDYNGFKIVLGGETLSGDRITALHTRLVEGQLESGEGQISQQRITAQYIERIGTDIQLEKPLKVVADCGNGIAGAVAPRLLEAIGAEVIPLYAEVDGTFPNHHPDPGDPKTLEDLRLCVRNFNADVGVAFEGDGDRLGVVSSDGEIIYPDRLMMLFARDVLSRNPGEPIIFDVKCSSLLAVEIEKAGGKPVMGRTGHSFIKERLKRERAPLAGEMSGHFFFSERWFGFDDGIYAAARLLEIMAADRRAPAQIFTSLPKAESTPELKVEMKEGEPHPFVEEFARSINFEDAEINNIDGVRADFADGFGLVRASNTTPVLVVRFEGTDKKALERIKELFRAAMLEVNPALKLPF